MKYYCTQVRLGCFLSKRQKITSTNEDVKKGELLCTGAGNVNWYRHYGKQYGSVSKN